jgi:uncharacterized protein YjdB
MRSRFDASRFDTSLIGMQWALRLLIVAIALLALAACSDDPTGDSRAVVNVLVTSAAPAVETGDSLLLTATPRQADGRPRNDVAVTWMSMDTEIATVQARAGQKAIVFANEPGTVKIRAMAGDKVGEATIEVVITDVNPQPVLTSIAPAAATEGDPLTELTLTGQNFTELSLVQWNGVSIGTQFVSATELRGLVPASHLSQVGTAEIRVLTGPPGGGPSQAKTFPINGRVASVEVRAPQTILWVGERIQLTATPKDGNGNELPPRPTQWTSGDPEVIAVSNTGVITPLREGYADVHAVVEGKAATEGIYVFAAPNYDLMFDSNPGGNNRELWIMSLGVDSVPRRWLPEGVMGEDATTNPDGTRIAFVCRDQYMNTDICVANRDGSGLTRLTTHGGADDNPAWSRDGSQIAFRSARASHGQSQIWIMNADGSNQRNLMGDSYNVVDASQSKPSFGTNGRIYFQVYYPWEEINRLGSIPVNGSWQDVVIHSAGGWNDSDPVVSWDGSKILLRRKQGSIDYGLQYVDLNGNPIFSANYPGPGYGASWSRNDQWIAYSHSLVGNNAVDVFVTRVNEVWRKRITVAATMGLARNPVFIKR